MITLYGFGRVHRGVIGVTRDLRVAWALEETGLPYRFHGLDHTAGEFDSEAFSRLSYFHQAPIIDDGGFVLSESAAILLYLAEKSGRLIPDDFQGRTRVVQWCFAALATIETPLAELLVVDKFGRGKADPRRANLVKWADRVLGGAEQRLEGRSWIACDDFTVADILLACVLREIQDPELLDPYPRVRAYFERALARPAWQRALAAYADRHGVPVDEIA